MTMWDLFLEWKDGSTCESWSMKYATSPEWKGKTIQSIHAEETFDKIQHSSIIKAFKNCEQESYTWIYKGYIWQTHKEQNQWWKSENIFSKIMGACSYHSYST